MNKIRLLIILSAMLMSACQTQHKVVATQPVPQPLMTEEVIEKANQAFDNHHFKKAMDLYDKVIEQQADNLQIIFWASQAAHAVKDYDREINYLLQLKKYDINSLKPRALLVQAYQNTGDSVKRDIEHQQIVQLWKDKMISENSYVRDTFAAGEYGVVVFDNFALKEGTSRKYVFVPQKEKGKYPFAISLSTQMKDSEGQTIYSVVALDGKKLYQYDIYKTEPGYDEIRKIATEIIVSDGPENHHQHPGIPHQLDLKTWLFGGKKALAKQNPIPYQYAFQRLPQLYFEDPERFLKQLNQHGKKYLQTLAKDLNEENKSKTKILDSEAIDYSITQALGNTVVMISLPKPDTSPEPYYIALVSSHDKPEKYRYFTFEKMALAKSETAVLCELTIEGRRNFGIGSENPDQENFLALILEVLQQNIRLQVQSDSRP